MNHRKSSIAMRADALLIDATTISALIEPAITAINVAAAGWPTSTPGADPATASKPNAIKYDSDGNPISDTYTATEKAALNRDPALIDLRAMEKAIKAANVQLRLAAILASKWANPGLNEHTIEKRLAAVDAGIWCDNCSKHGHKNPRRQDGRTCEFCAGFQSDWKQPAPKDVLDLRVTKGRVYESDIRRILARVRDTRKDVAS